MSLRLITAPATMPVSLAEVKANSRIDVDNSDEDTFLSGLIAAATDHVENYTGRALVSQTWELVLDAFSPSILLPKGPVTSIVSVKYFDPDEAEQTVSPANYALDDVADPQWLVRASNYSWPAVADGINNVTIRFICGYATVPPAIKHAILLLVDHWDQNRSATSDKPVSTVPHAVDDLLVNYRSFVV
tara:strand:+ start:3535 stop:4098 length:564 start_codon:yes stop_codon:yes gene_type:complete